MDDSSDGTLNNWNGNNTKSNLFTCHKAGSALGANSGAAQSCSEYGTPRCVKLVHAAVRANTLFIGEDGGGQGVPGRVVEVRAMLVRKVGVKAMRGRVMEVRAM